MKAVILTRNEYALVDDEDYEKVSQYKWFCTAYGYAKRKDSTTGKQIEMGH